jgi:2',3'-cyclic-nucleotide 2'-phosphodiesterase/3'-nucleotidase
MKLTILVTSDVHGYLYPRNYLNDSMDLPNSLFKAATVIEEERAKAEGPVLLMDNGDFIQGSPLSQYVEENHQSPKVLIDALNNLNYDVGVLGNHEFNYGLDYLKAGIETANHPVLSANILQKSNDYFADAPATIIEKEGLKIGVLGLTTQYIPHWEHPANISDLTFHSALKTAKEWVPKLRKEADIVVVAYHGGFESDLVTGAATENHTGENEGYQLLTEIPGIDALITGHQHREIASVINHVPVIQPGYKGANLGKIVLELEKTAGEIKVIGGSAELLSVADAKADAKLVETYTPLKKELDSWLDKVIGQTKGNMRIADAALARIEEHPYVEFINRVQLHYGQADISATALFSNIVSGYDKKITVRDVILNYPYPNTLAVIKVTGTELKEALEQSASYFTLNELDEIIVHPKFKTPKAQPYNYDMYEGIDYTIDVSKPIGERLIRFRFKDRDIQPNDTFELVTNQYRAVGGGNFSMFEGKEFHREINLSMSDLITEYIKKHKIIEAKVNNNFKVVNSAK